MPLSSLRPPTCPRTLYPPPPPPPGLPACCPVLMYYHESSQLAFHRASVRLTLWNLTADVSVLSADMQKKQAEAVPEVEWWDAPLLPSGSYEDVADDGGVTLQEGKLTMYVEHPVPIEPPLEAPKPPPQPLKLTKVELKKLRTQRRRQREMEKQELIRQVSVTCPKRGCTPRRPGPLVHLCIRVYVFRDHFPFRQSLHSIQTASNRLWASLVRPPLGCASPAFCMIVDRSSGSHPPFSLRHCLPSFSANLTHTPIAGIA